MCVCVCLAFRKEFLMNALCIICKGQTHTHTTKSTDRPNWPTEVHTESHWPQNNAFNLSLIGYSFDVYASPFGSFRTARNVSNTILSPIYRTMFSNKMRLYFVIGYIHWWWNMFIEWNSQHTAPIELGQFSILIFVVKVHNVRCPRCVCQFDTRQIFYQMKANILWCVCVWRSVYCIYACGKSVRFWMNDQYYVA